MPKEAPVKVILTFDPVVAKLLATLDDDPKEKELVYKVTNVLDKLADHAQQGVYRPGAWERGWLQQAFGTDFQSKLQPGDPYGRATCAHIFQKPKSSLPSVA